MKRGRGFATRVRILDAAETLFYRKGVQRSGVDDVMAAAGHTKPTLYALFGSKERLLKEVLGRRFEARRRAVEAMLASIDDPLDRLRALLDNHQQVTALPGFRGCPLVNASIEMEKAGGTLALTKRYKHWLRDLLAALAREGGLREPASLARGLLLLVEGANVMSYVESSSHAGKDMRRAAEALIVLHRPDGPRLP